MQVHYIANFIEIQILPGASSGHDRVDCAGSENGGAGSGPGSAPGSGEEDQWSLWSRIVADWDAYNAATGKRKTSLVPVGSGSGGDRNQPCIKELVRKGVPHHFRGIVWQLLCGAHDSPDKKQYAEYIKV